MTISRFARLPITTKLRLVITVACLIVVALTCATFLAYDWIAYRRESVRIFKIRAEILASNATASLAFNNPDDGTDVLKALHADTETMVALIFNPDGSRFAAYFASYKNPPIAFRNVSRTETQFKDGTLIVWSPIMLSDRRLGVFALQEDLSSLSTRLRLYIAITLLIMAFAAIAAYWLSNRLQRVISNPVLALAQTAKFVTENKNYRLRASPANPDEIGVLTNAFNAMLSQIEERQSALIESESRVRAVVDSALDGVFTINHLGEIIEFNPAAERMFGYSRPEVIGRNFICLILPALAGTTKLEGELFDSRKQKNPFGKRMVATAARANGADFPVDLAITRINYSGDPIFTVFIRDITEAKRAEEDLHRAADRLATINRLDRIISASLNINEVYDAFVREMSGFEAFDQTTITRVNKANRTWEVIRQWNRTGEALPIGTMGPLENTGLGWVLEHEQPLIEADISVTEKWDELKFLLDCGIKSRACLPLVLQGNIIGVLMVGSSRTGAFDHEALEFLQALADQLVVAAQNARLYEQIQRHASELEQRVTERTGQLEAANHELEAFSYSVSHDLRAPLRAMAGFSQILVDDYAKDFPEEARGFLQRIQLNARHMGRLIDDLLTFSRLGRQALALYPLDIARMCRECADDLQGDYAGRNVEFKIADLPRCMGDPSLMRQVLLNLIGNSIKYSRPRNPAVIEITAVQQPNEIGPVYRIADNGVGFDMRYAQKLFGVFQRLHRADEFEGTGVGLATVQRIINRHGGRIWAESTLDVGSTFFFTLPSVSNL